MLARSHDRLHAGQILARYLELYARRPDVLVLGLPRGGVPVAFEIARALFDVFLVRKLGAPGHEELAMGASASGARLINRAVVDALAVTQAQLDAVLCAEERERERRERLSTAGRASGCRRWPGDHFGQTTDAEVRVLLDRAEHEQAEHSHARWPRQRCRLRERRVTGRPWSSSWARPAAS